MTRMLLPALCAAALIAPPALAAPGPWIHKEFAVPGAVPLPLIEAFLNEECRPSGLDGIQPIAVQRGHEDALHLHVHCRQDKAKARYRVTLPTAPKGKALGIVGPAAAKPNAKVGPFYFGEKGGDDGFVLIEKIG